RPGGVAVTAAKLCAIPLVCVMFPACLFAVDTSTTQPARPLDRRPYGPVRAMRRPMVPGMGPGNGGGQNLGPIGEDEMGQIETFMKAYSPKRWEKLQQDVPEDRRKRILDNIRMQYRWMERLKEEDPTIYDIRIKRLPVEDEMFEIGWELHHGDPKSPPDLRKRLREQVRL